MAYSIMNADLKHDRDSIISLWERNLQDHGVPEGRYDWIYDNNPNGPPICFLLKHDLTDAIAGSYTLFPRQVVVNGRQVRAFACGDLIVDTAHRALGPALILVKAALARCEEEGCLLFGFPNELSQPVLLYSGFDVLCDHLKMTKVVKAYPYIKKYINSRLIARALSWPLDVILSCRPCDLFRPRIDAYCCDVITTFDERFDDFWQKTKNVFSLKGESESRYLNWRFKNSPYAEHFVYTLTSVSDGHLAGYIVFRLIENRAHIKDIAFHPGDDSLDLLISSFHHHPKLKNIESIAFGFAGDSLLTAQLIKNGFSIRFRELKTIIYTSEKQNTVIEEIENGRWYLTAGDNDI